MTAHDVELQPLKLIEHEGRYSLLLNAGDTSVDELIEDLGHEPNGYFWDGVARLLVESHAPDLAERFETDPEGGMFAAVGTDKDALIRLGKLLASYANDAAKMRALVADADAAGFDFDD